MPTFISPRVNVQEIDLSTTIPAVATSIAVLVLRSTYKGPEMTQEYITNENQLIEKFGKPRKRIYTSGGVNTTVADCYQDLYSAIGYLKYGNALYCTRVLPEDSTFAGVDLASSTAETTGWVSPAIEDAYTLNTQTSSGDIDDPDEFHEETDLIGTDQIKFIAASRGYWGNNNKIAIVDYMTQKLVLEGTLDKDAEGNPIVDENNYYTFRVGDNTAYIDGTVKMHIDVYNAISSIDSPLESGNCLIIVQTKEQNTDIWETMETHNVSLQEDAKDDMGQTQYIENVINNNSDYIRVALGDAYKNEDVPSGWVT